MDAQKQLASATTHCYIPPQLLYFNLICATLLSHFSYARILEIILNAHSANSHKTVEVTINTQKRKPCTDAKPSQTWNPALWFVTCDSEHNTWQKACAIFRSFMISSELPTGYATATTSMGSQRSKDLKLIQPGCEHIKCFYLEMSFGMFAFESVQLFRTAHSNI